MTDAPERSISSTIRRLSDRGNWRLDARSLSAFVGATEPHDGKHLYSIIVEEPSLGKTALRRRLQIIGAIAGFFGALFGGGGHHSSAPQPAPQVDPADPQTFAYFQRANAIASPLGAIVFSVPALLVPGLGGVEATAAGLGGEVEAAGAVESVSAAERAEQIAAALESKDANYMTIGVTNTAEGVRIVSSSQKFLRPAALQALQENEIEAYGMGHAEVTGVNFARSLGLNPVGTAASRPICSECAAFLENEGVAALSALKK